MVVWHRILLMTLSVILFPLVSTATIRVVDPGPIQADATWGGVSGTSYTTSLVSGLGYTSLEAIYNDGNGCAGLGPGDIIYLRGGVYTENYGDSNNAMPLPFSVDGNSTDWIKIASYPGEWAVLDASGSGKRCCTGYYGLGSTGGGSLRNPAYWIIERLEITGASGSTEVAGLAIDRGPFKVRYCIIHDNTAASHNENPGGIRGYHWMNSTIEFCYFENNGSASGHNSGHIVVFSDYHNTPYTRDTFNISDSRHSNEIQYNYFHQAVVGYKEKGRQFLKTSPSDRAHQDKATKVHHNIFTACSSAIVTDTDYQQVYNNISDGATLQFTLNRGGVENENVCMYDAVIYNNTILDAPLSIGIGYDEDVANIDLQLHMYNNIISHYGVGTYEPSIGLITQQCYGDYCSGIADQRDAVYTWDQTIIDRNFVHDPQAPQHIGLPHSYACCRQDRWVTVDAFNTDHSVDNYTNSNTGLFQGPSGADQYSTISTFALQDPDTTVANGGIGGVHPYLAGTNLPSYIGATNPTDRAWVTGVLALTDSSTMQNAPGGDPAWVEGGGGANDITPPSIPQNLQASTVSTTQIDLSWDASTDDLTGIAGYRIFRNGVAIDTTTNTTYSDTGLEAEATYSYTVSAYDAAYNESAQCSATMGTTESGQSGNNTGSGDSGGGCFIILSGL